VRAGRRLLTPQVVHQAVERDDLVGVQEQHGEEGPVPAAAQRERLLTVQDLQRSQDSKVHLAAGSLLDEFHS